MDSVHWTPLRISGRISDSVSGRELRLATLDPHVGLIYFSQVSDNNLSALVDEVCDLSNLTTLNVSRNKLTSVPRGIGRLTDLKLLKINANRLTELPDTIGGLVVLEQLVRSTK